MSQQNLETVRSWFEPRFRAWDPEKVLDWMYEHAWDPDIDWRATEGTPDDVGVMHGRDSLRRYFEDWQDTFDNLVLEAEDIIDAGDDRVVVAARLSGQAKLSGVPAELRYAIVFTLREGKAVRGREYMTLAAALEAVGLPART